MSKDSKTAVLWEKLPFEQDTSPNFLGHFSEYCRTLFRINQDTFPNFVKAAFSESCHKGESFSHGHSPATVIHLRKMSDNIQFVFFQRAFKWR